MSSRWVFFLLVFFSSSVLGYIPIDVDVKTRFPSEGRCASTARYQIFRFIYLLRVRAASRMVDFMHRERERNPTYCHRNGKRKC